ncbi:MULTISPECIES: acyltransferase family protein [Acinetobacter]|uniref:acyltransferase family protein n=1 Tax=Acinetobacter TaxID=469 RepID=UPI0015D33EA4|nr:MULTISPECIES: acyltransferase [Acinetobacter]MDM1276422.1 acyltransferase [Acinetobacter indicus]QSQ96896.1 acyltransferase [Acinetobacter indicus]
MFWHYRPLSPQLSLQLESLRGWSAILVLFSHCFQAFIGPLDQTLYSGVRLLGQAAVMMFFVLSGYLIGHSIRHNIHRHRQFSGLAYSRQRCQRILGPFLFAMLLTLLLYALAPYFFASGSHGIEASQSFMIRHSYDISAADFLGSLFFVNGFVTPTVSANAALWSLSYEVWFYVLAGCLVTFRLGSILLFLTLLLGLSLLNIQFLIYFLVWLLAFAFASPAWSKQIPAAQLHYFKSGFLLLAVLIALFDAYQFHSIYLAQYYTGENFRLFNLCIGIAAACWLLQLARGERQIQVIWPASAQFSYTLYITHFPLLIFILGCFPFTLQHGLGVALLSLIITMAVLIGFAWLVAQKLEPPRRIERHLS